LWLFEQVKNTEKSKASIVEAEKCLATVKSAVPDRESNVGLSSEVKSVARKLRERRRQGL